LPTNAKQTTWYKDVIKETVDNSSKNKKLNNQLSIGQIQLF